MKGCEFGGHSEKSTWRCLFRVSHWLKTGTNMAQIEWHRADCAEFSAGRMGRGGGANVARATCRRFQMKFTIHGMRNGCYLGIKLLGPPKIIFVE